MTVSEERRAALRGFFEASQRGQNRGVTFVEVADILGVLDDLDAAEGLAATLEGLLRESLEWLQPIWQDPRDPALRRFLRRAVAALAPAAPDSGSDSSTAAEEPKAEEPPAALWSDGRGDAVCSACGAVVECRHHERFLSAHRPDCPLAEAR